jgi:hypothetical protein
MRDKLSSFSPTSSRFDIAPDNMATAVLTALAGAIALYCLAQILLRLTQDANEPPTLDISIPFISPMWNMTRKGYQYWIPQR